MCHLGNSGMSGLRNAGWDDVEIEKPGKEIHRLIVDSNMIIK